MCWFALRIDPGVVMMGKGTVGIYEAFGLGEGFHRIL